MKCPGSGIGPQASLMQEREDGWYAECPTCGQVVKLEHGDRTGLLALDNHEEQE